MRGEIGLKISELFSGKREYEIGLCEDKYLDLQRKEKENGNSFFLCLYPALYNTTPTTATL